MWLKRLRWKLRCLWRGDRCARCGKLIRQAGDMGSATHLWSGSPVCEPYPPYRLAQWQADADREEEAKFRKESDEFWAMVRETQELLDYANSLPVVDDDDPAPDDSSPRCQCSYCLAKPVEHE